jgi:hypothetical protein
MLLLDNKQAENTYNTTMFRLIALLIQIESTRRVSVGLNYTNIEPIKMKTFFKYKLYQVNFLLSGTSIWLQNNFILFTLFNFWRPISS